MKPDQNKLSPKQSKILEFIESEISRFGRPPTYRDIAKFCGYDAVGTVQDHVRALIKKGFLEREEGVARGIKPTYRTQSLDIPILGTVPAGRPVEAIEESLGSLSIPAKWSGDLFALRVTGESMINAGILDGDLVVVKKTTDVRDGDIVVAMIDGEATVKTLEKKRGSPPRLLPANPRFSPIEIPYESQNMIQGKVVSLQRTYE